MTTGQLIVIDGTDGSGKGTQATLLVERLRQEGRTVELCDFPQYDSPSAYFVEKYLRGEYGSIESVTAKQASLFYALDRYDASFRMRMLLRDGVTIVSNRYASSNMGHQAGKLQDADERKACVAWLTQLEYEILGIPRPDINILLYVPPEVGQQLVDQKSARTYVHGAKRDIHEADINHLRHAAQSYREVAESEGWSIVNCMHDGALRSRESIHEEVYRLL
jgi:dTMP kinase